MARILAFDYGKKRTGLAVSDPLGIIATPLDTVETKQLFAFVKQYMAKEQVDTFVVGLPKHLDNSDSETTTMVRQFAEKLQAAYPQVAFHWIDERFTSKMALDALIAAGSTKKDRRDKGNIDKVSATIILQTYMESRT